MLLKSEIVDRMKPINKNKFIGGVKTRISITELEGKNSNGI